MHVATLLSFEPFSLQYIIIRNHWQMQRWEIRKGISNASKWEIDIITKTLDMVISRLLEEKRYLTTSQERIPVNHKP